MLKQIYEFGHGQPGFANQSPKRTLGELLVVRDRQTPVRRGAAPENDVAPVLLIRLLTDSAERLDRLATRDDRQLHQPVTSIISS